MPKTKSNRNFHLHIRLSEFEKEELENITAITGQSITDFVRIAIFEKKERVRIYDENKTKKVN